MQIAKTQIRTVKSFIGDLTANPATLGDSENFVRLGEWNQMVIRTREFVRRAGDVNPLIDFVDKSVAYFSRRQLDSWCLLVSGPVNY